MINHACQMYAEFLADMGKPAVPRTSIAVLKPLWGVSFIVGSNPAAGHGGRANDNGGPT